MVVQFENPASKVPGGPVKTVPGCTSGVSDSLGLECILRTCILNRFLSDADVAGPDITF